ncbi:carbohydrate ABC transporter permease [Butyrivibrio sp. MB2005]|uniref:carbohydrate ABC transporter permease n=1 Tax=Butyrivibrio sp. MB2005 TaxID=1280678 RepID=UPI0003FB7315|nr:carbohydrate ABC transporter permease [Butyrivibrio sp. MB2005]
MGRTREKRVKIFAFICLLLVAIVMLVPMLWIFISSFKVESEVIQAGGFLFFPKTWTLQNFREILDFGNKQLPVYNWFVNSFVVSGLHTILAVILYSLSAYAYAKLKFKGRDFIFISMMFLSSFPAITNIIPMYKIMHNLHWLNHLVSLIIPGLAGVYNIFLIRQFIIGIPDSLLESARIDGANEFFIYRHIIVPCCKPILIAVGLFTFTGSWNDFLWPSIAINNLDRLTLTAGLQLAKGVYGNKIAQMSAIATIAIVPMIILYMFTQKYFVKGINISSGVKG